MVGIVTNITQKIMFSLEEDNFLYEVLSKNLYHLCMCVCININYTSTICNGVVKAMSITII